MLTFTINDLSQLYPARDINSYIRFQPDELDEILSKLELPTQIEFCGHRRISSSLAVTIMLRRLSGNPRYVDLSREFSIQKNLLSAANVAMIRL